MMASDPDLRNRVNIPRSTILGTLATAVVYMLSLTAVFGILPGEALSESTAPFSDAVNSMFGGTGWGDQKLGGTVGTGMTRGPGVPVAWLAASVWRWAANGSPGSTAYGAGPAAGWLGGGVTAGW